MKHALPGGRARVALVVAIAADLVQWVLLPLTLGGAVSPINDALDAGVAVLMILLVGWHWAFLPAFVTELIPVVDLVPTWTLSVWLATRGHTAAAVPPGPKPPATPPPALTE